MEFEQNFYLHHTIFTDNTFNHKSFDMRRQVLSLVSGYVNYISQKDFSDITYLNKVVKIGNMTIYTEENIFKKVSLKLKIFTKDKYYTIKFRSNNYETLYYQLNDILLYINILHSTNSELKEILKPIRVNSRFHFTCKEKRRKIFGNVTKYIPLNLLLTKFKNTNEFLNSSETESLDTIEESTEELKEDSIKEEEESIEESEPKSIEESKPKSIEEEYLEEFEKYLDKEEETQYHIPEIKLIYENLNEVDNLIKTWIV